MEVAKRLCALTGLDSKGEEPYVETAADGRPVLTGTPPELACELPWPSKKINRLANNMREDIEDVADCLCAVCSQYKKMSEMATGEPAHRPSSSHAPPCRVRGLVLQLDRTVSPERACTARPHRLT